MNRKVKKKNNNNSSNSLVFGRWPQTKIAAPQMLKLSRRLWRQERKKDIKIFFVGLRMEFLIRCVAKMRVWEAWSRSYQSFTSLYLQRLYLNLQALGKFGFYETILCQWINKDIVKGYKGFYAKSNFHSSAYKPINSPMSR